MIQEKQHDRGGGASSGRIRGQGRRSKAWWLLRRCSPASGLRRPPSARSWIGAHPRGRGCTRYAACPKEPVLPAACLSYPREATTPFLLRQPQECPPRCPIGCTSALPVALVGPPRRPRAVPVVSSICCQGTCQRPPSGPRRPSPPSPCRIRHLPNPQLEDTPRSFSHEAVAPEVFHLRFVFFTGVVKNFIMATAFPPRYLPHAAMHKCRHLHLLCAFPSFHAARGCSHHTLDVSCTDVNLIKKTPRWTSAINNQGQTANQLQMDCPNLSMCWNR
ncbi:uncharacterized protein [Triticum aestivum]|uniref:uncharacterized protein isoform X3 n=1 Tax=Triticum aestivum TaxID=4565 RepID=UPI001D002C0C|nr:uncharacterized protein LOC123102022 isoform X3 [Triticum aestivum]XP_044379216.1 uncharacterized protein LOC123102022 isoform X3 [Triticum aestivum]